MRYSHKRSSAPKKECFATALEADHSVRDTFLTQLFDNCDGVDGL